MKHLGLIGLFVLGPGLAANGQVLSLSGTDWKIKDVPNGSATAFCSDWLPATVPGNVQADLETARLLKPLWYGAGDPRLFEVAKHDWHYRKVFNVPAEFAGRRIRLVFDGVDYACEVWLNGRRLGSNPNMFRRFEFDVAAQIVPGEPNTLDVRIEQIPAVLIPFIEKGDGKLSGRYTDWFFIKGILKTIETLKDLKSPTNFAYDWGFNIWTLGIWKDVRLEASGPAVMKHVKIETPLENDYAKAVVRVDAAVDSLAKLDGTLRLTVSGHGPDQVVEKKLALSEGSNAVHAEVPLDHPALWWPNGHGEQNLYHLEAALVDASGRLSHVFKSRFGVREVRWELTAEPPAEVREKYLPVINGRRIRMIGSNLIPPDLLFARIPERAPHLLRTAQAAGFTALRVWGGGVIFPAAIYDLADELGLMLMLEIPIANTDPKPDPGLLKNLDLTLPAIIRQVWNHPAIIEYNGGNEMRYGADAGDFTVIEHIRKIFAEVDPSRVFRDKDPAAGGAHGKWHFPLDLRQQIDPLGVYAWWNYVMPRVPDGSGAIPAGPKSKVYPVMRNGEFGVQTAGHLETWLRDIPPASQWPVEKEDPILIRKNVTYAVFNDNVWLERPTIDFLFGDAPNLEFLLKGGQYFGGEGLRYAMDAVRRRGLATGGMMSWDFNEPWTNGAGSYLIDYDGRPLMGHAFLQQATAQLSLSLRHATSLYDLRDGVRTTLYLTSDADRPRSGLKWSWRARDRRGAVIVSDQGAVDVSPIEVKKLADIVVPNPPRTAFGPIFVELRLDDAQGRLVHERVHVFGLKGVRSPLRGLLAKNLLDQDDDPPRLQPLLDGSGTVDAKGSQMPEISRPVARTSLQLGANTPHRDGDHEVWDITLTNAGKMTALYCEPKPILNYRTDLIIENLYVCIPPGETRTMTIRAPVPARDGLTLAQTGWKIDCWNAETVELPPSSDIILALGRADRMCREFAGYPGLRPPSKRHSVRVEGRQPDPGAIPLLMDASTAVDLEFPSDAGAAAEQAILRVHAADQSVTGALLGVELNGKPFEARFPEGYGLQKNDPSHLARARTIEISIPAGTLRRQGNLLRVQVRGGGWFTWDALDLRVIRAM